MADFLKLHLVAMVAAMAVGVLSGIPQHLSQSALGSNYQGVPYLFQDAEAVYLTRIQEIEDGDRDVSSPFLHEYKEGKSVMPPTGEYLYWLISKVTGLSIISVLEISKYVFPAMLFLLIYAFVMLLMKEGKEGESRRLLSISAALAVTLGYELVDVGTALAIFNGSYSSTYLSLWSRAVNPIMGALLLFGFFISLLVLLRGKYLAAIPTVVLFGLMSGYIFSFGIAGTTLVLFTLALIISREYRKAICLFAVLIMVLIINLPSSFDPLEAAKSGLLLTRMPMISTVLVASFLALALGLFRDYKRKISLSLTSPQLFLSIVLFASFIAMNQQVITGRTVWPHHFVQYTIPLSMIVALVFFYIYIRPHFSRLWRVVPIGIICLSVIFSLFSLTTYKNRLHDYKNVNSYGPILSWLGKNKGPCVVLPVGETEQINSYITALTHCDVYFTHYTFIGIPEERIVHNELVNMVFQGVSRGEAEEYLSNHEERIRAVLFRDWVDLFRHSSDEWLASISDRDEIDLWVKSKIKELAKEYGKFSEQDFRTTLLKYRLDYVLHDKEGKIPFDIKQFQFLEKVYEDERFIIYEI